MDSFVLEAKLSISAVSDRNRNDISNGSTKHLCINMFSVKTSLYYRDYTMKIPMLDLKSSTEACHWQATGMPILKVQTVPSIGVEKVIIKTHLLL